MPKKIQEEIVKEGLKPLLEQIRISMQVLPQHCVQQQHWVNYLSQSGMLQELPGPAVRKAESLSQWKKNRSSQGDADKNCSQFFPGQRKSGTHSVQEGPVWQKGAGKGLAAAPSSALGDLNNHQGWENTDWGCQMAQHQMKEIRCGQVLWWWCLKSLGCKFPYLAEVMPVGSAEFLIPCCSIFMLRWQRLHPPVCAGQQKWTFIKLLLQRLTEGTPGRKTRIISKCDSNIQLQTAWQNILPPKSFQASLQHVQEHRSEELWPLLGQVTCRNHTCTSTNTKGNCSNKHHVVQSSRNGWKFSKWDKWQSIFLKYITFKIGGHEPYCSPHT